MKAAWASLQDLMTNRAKRLAGAHEIHKFNRDAKELLDRLQVCGQVLCVCVCVCVCVSCMGVRVLCRGVCVMYVGGMCV